MIDERESAAIERIQLKPFATGAHINKDDLRLKNSITMAIEQMKLRQWAVEQAVKYASEDLEACTNFIFNFVTQQENSDDKTA